MRAGIYDWPLIRPLLGAPRPAHARMACLHGPMLLYALHDYDPERDGDQEAWAASLAWQGWRMWEPGSGPWITLEGRRFRRWSLHRAPVDECQA